MYHVQEIDFTCPTCGQVHKFHAYDVISRHEQKEVMEKILDRSIFEFVCPTCGHVEPVLYPVLYQDREKDVMIHMSDAEGIDDTFDALDPSMHTLRTVKNPNELIEKISIFEKGYDDRAVEVVKLLRRNMLLERNPYILIDAMYFTPQKDGDKFAVMGKDSLIGYIRFDEDMYDRAVTGVVEEASDANKNAVEIDLAWAERVVMEM